MQSATAATTVANRWRVLDYLLAALLGFAAVGKSWVLITDQFADLKLGYPSAVLWLAIILEFGLAFLLVSRADALIKTAFSLVLFTMFLVATLVRFASGSPDCGCFGLLESSTEFSLLLNVVLLSLLLSRLWLDPAVARGSVTSTGFTWLSRNVVPVGLFIGTACVLPFAITGELPAHIDRILHGAPPISATTQSLGEVPLGMRHPVSFRLINHGESDIEIVGTKSSCECLAGDNVDGYLPAGSTQTLEALIAPGEEGWFRQTLLVYLRCDQQPVVAVDFVGFASQEN